MHLVDNKDPVLKTRCIEFDFASPPFDPLEFSNEFVKFMYEKNGIGLAANQIGIPYRVFAMRGSPENFVCFNPCIILPSTQNVLLEEGCVSFPGLFIKIKRSQHVVVRFQTPTGDTKTEMFTDITARVFQHELDHLDGEVFFRRANPYHRNLAFKRMK